jgi:1-deoxy-D-xylulose-5-phosphate reductoisomerase
MSEQHGLAILGSTGSIGVQALQVLADTETGFRPVVLTARSRTTELIAQARQWLPDVVVLGDANSAAIAREALHGLPIEVAYGPEALEEVVQRPTVHRVLNALVGSAGLLPTARAIQAGKDIALANKETLVVAGQWVMEQVAQTGVRLLPVDSEHSALFQCLTGEDPKTIERLILTASGGPFRGKSRTEVATVTPAQALRHPNWSMGAKITIDSATLLNKGLEFIEAYWLFSVEVRQIEVVIHPQSIIHSIVEFQDGSMKAQLSLPDMRLPIQYALTYPSRPLNRFPRLQFQDYPLLSFEPLDESVFRGVALAREALRLGGCQPCVLNAANEIAVQYFLNNQLTFLGIYSVIERALERFAYEPNTAHTPQELIAIDAEVRRFCLLDLLPSQR